MLRIRPVLLLTPLLATALAAAMGSCSTPRASPPDGGVSTAGSGGIAVDAGDAGDTADHPDLADAPVEASGEAGWVPVSWKAICDVQVAQHPDLAVPKLIWGPCPGNAPGCEGVVVNWEKGTGPPLGAVTVVPWGNGYRVGAGMIYPDSETRTAVFDVDGSPLVAWRAVTPCLPIVPRVGPEHIWFGVQGEDPQGKSISNYIVAPYTTIAATSEAISVIVPEQDIDSNDTILSLEGLTGDVQSIFDLPGNQVTTVGPSPGFGFDLAHPVNDSALMLFFPDFEKPEAWIWNRSSHAATPLIQPSPEVVMDIRSDGATIAWLQVPPKAQSDGFFPPGNLWTSPFATSKAALQPTKRRPIGMIGGVSGTAGQGFYAMYGGTFDRKIHVYRLSDARHWEFVPPMEVGHLREISYVDPKSVWYWTVTGVYRQALDALGPGDPPP